MKQNKGKCDKPNYIDSLCCKVELIKTMLQK